MRIRLLGDALVCVSLAALIAVLCEALIYLPSAGGRPAALPAAGYSADFVTIILTAVTVILAATTIVVALAGIVGYTTIRDAARKAASEVAHAQAEAVALVKSEEVATRVAEATANRLLGRSDDVGDEFFRKQTEADDAATGD